VVAVLGMTKRKVVMNEVAVAASVRDFRHVTRLLQVADDPGDRSFRDADRDGDVSEAYLGISGDALEHVPVVSHESPVMIALSRT
jgi:hypothetical protein